MKELTVAMIYTAGILLPVFAVSDSQPKSVQILVIAIFCLTALVNLLLFSLFDREHDKSHKQHSFATRFGSRVTRHLIAWLCVTNIVLATTLTWAHHPRVSVIFTIMNLSLFGIVLFERRLARGDLYRIVGDGVFYLPVLFLL